MSSLQRDASSQKWLHASTWPHILNVFVVELVVESLFDGLLLLGDFVQGRHLHAGDHHLEEREREEGRHVRLGLSPTLGQLRFPPRLMSLPHLSTS